MANPEVAIAFPFTIDEFGNIGKTDNVSKIWADRVRAVIGTTFGERVMRTEFGTSLEKGVFETRSAMETLAVEEVTDAFKNQLPSLTLGDVTLSYDDVYNTLSVDVTYSLPSRAIETTSATVGSVFISGNNQAKEVM